MSSRTSKFVREKVGILGGSSSVAATPGLLVRIQYVLNILSGKSGKMSLLFFLPRCWSEKGMQYVGFRVLLYSRVASVSKCDIQCNSMIDPGLIA